METTFQLTMDDWQAFNRAVKGRNLWNYIFIPLALLVSLAQFGLDRSFMLRLKLLQMRLQFGGWGAISQPVAWMVAPVLVPILIITVFFVVVTRVNRRNLAKQPMFVAPIAVRADEEGVTGSSIVGRDTIFWRALHQIVETPTHLFILRAPQVGIIVPKRAFATPDEAAHFVEYVRARFGQARPETPPLATP